MMTNAQLATASLNDIVFDGRNQRYGAYELRALYQRHVTRALGIATTIFALLLVFPLAAQLLKDDAVVVPTIVEAKPTIYDLPEQPTIVTPSPPRTAVQPPTAPPQPPTIKNVVPVVVDDNTPTNPDDVPNHSDLLDKQSGTRTIVGEPGAEPNIPDDLPSGPENPVTADVNGGKPYTYVEQMPQLPGGGGTAAIVAAIQKAVRYPSKALQNQIEGRIYVSFTVDPTGEVTDVKIVKGLGYGLDEETMRAINTLPRFIPGKQNGREVSVSFTVPVSYKIQ